MMDNIDLFMIISIAFLGSFGHCIGMCGGIVIAYSAKKINNNWSKSYQSLSHLLYSFGRITTYTLYGAIFGLIGSVISFSNMANGILLIVAGLAMVLTGLSLSGRIKFLTSIEHSIQGSKWYKNNFKQLLNSEDVGSFYLLGLLNGLLPCGFVYFFAITAASTANAFDGAIVMFVFGLSTIPAMFSLGFFVAIFKKTDLRNIIIHIAALSVLIYGIYTIYSGYEYIENPNKTLLDCCSVK
jgi:sulfite exporter TauE/SafE